jgi:hypothetical protein
MEKLIPLMLVFAAILGMGGVAVPAVRWARKSSRRATFLGLGTELLGAGMNPHPPAQTHLEEASRQTRIKKESETGEPEER